MPGFARQFAKVRCTQVSVMSVKMFSLTKHLVLKNDIDRMRIKKFEKLLMYKMICCTNSL